MWTVSGRTSGLSSSVCHDSDPGNVLRSIASMYCVVPPDANGNGVNIGDLWMAATTGAASIVKGLPSTIFDSNESVSGTSTVAIVVVLASAGSWPASDHELAPACNVNTGTVP